ncbi:PLP-dependent aminotransferase family protein [Flavihumibacter petaseus]|uniref:Putative GntR family transcriptional regulator n=1 Tax=Flavihumibacter petaseus NBRC 106054 TaxID=1220578 RepID=A0A0E9N6R5_9BACT|nr:PLP-dependent aminotransferase family protein [Flavihumibacter petaseus]GAO45493.1 putative GntR family transcriptional regulator [Flavihumibacter petaseus NBRC 106054]
MKSSFLYADITDNIARLIRDKVLQPGDRLPSVRMLCEEHGISMNTAKRVFLELEAKSLIESKPQSGYFVCQPPFQRLPIPSVSNPSTNTDRPEPDDLLRKVYSIRGAKGVTNFSTGVPAKEFLPITRLNREIVQATRRLPAAGTEYEPLQGNENLRRMIAARSITWGGKLRDDDIITTAGGMNALSFCLMALSKPGNTIAMESPCYPGSLQLARSLGLKVLELPTHPVSGVEVDALKKVARKIDLCLLVPNFNTPLGSCMPEENKKAVVELLAKHGVPLIEDDIYGDLYFSTQRPKCCKTYDQEGNVLFCSSFSKTLAPGYRAGWVVPGKFKEQLLRLKWVHAISSSTITQEAIASFLRSGRYENHLRKLRVQLQQNYVRYETAITTWFPPDTRISRPQGGLALWVELNRMVNTSELFDIALKQKIGFSPGRMFTLQPQFDNCMRISLGVLLTPELEPRLKQLAKLVKAMR